MGENDILALDSDVHFFQSFTHINKQYIKWKPYVPVFQIHVCKFNVPGLIQRQKNRFCEYLYKLSQRGLDALNEYITWLFLALIFMN